MRIIIVDGTDEELAAASRLLHPTQFPVRHDRTSRYSTAYSTERARCLKAGLPRVEANARAREAAQRAREEYDARPRHPDWPADVD